MKNLLVRLAVFLAFSPGVLAGPGEAPAAQSASEEAKIIELDKQWYELRIKQDVAALEQLLAADFTLITSYGRILTREQLLDRNRSGGHFFKLKSFKTEDVKVKIYSEAAVVTGQASVDVEASDLRVGSTVRFIRIYARPDGRWRLAVQQATRIIR